MSLTRAEKLKKRSHPFFEPPMAVIGSKPPEANAAIGLSLSACLALSEVNPQNMAFGRKRLSGHILLSRYQKSPYMPPTRLRRRDALDQRIASLTRKTWPSAASGYQAMFALKVSKITVHAADF